MFVLLKERNLRQLHCRPTDKLHKNFCIAIDNNPATNRGVSVFNAVTPVEEWKSKRVKVVKVVLANIDTIQSFDDIFAVDTHFDTLDWSVIFIR